MYRWWCVLLLCPAWSTPPPPQPTVQPPTEQSPAPLLTYVERLRGLRPALTHLLRPHRGVQHVTAHQQVGTRVTLEEGRGVTQPQGIYVADHNLRQAAASGSSQGGEGKRGHVRTTGMGGGGERPAQLCSCCATHHVESLTGDLQPVSDSMPCHAMPSQHVCVAGVHLEGLPPQSQQRNTARPSACATALPLSMFCAVSPHPTPSHPTPTQLSLTVTPNCRKRRMRATRCRPRRLKARLPQPRSPVGRPEAAAAAAGV
jgi:hypothetical protein